RRRNLAGSRRAQTLLRLSSIDSSGDKDRPHQQLSQPMRFLWTHGAAPPPARARLRELRLGIQSEPKQRSNEQQTAQNYRRNATGCRISTHDKSLRPEPRGTTAWAKWNWLERGQIGTVPRRDALWWPLDLLLLKEAWAKGCVPLRM